MPPTKSDLIKAVKPCKPLSKKRAKHPGWGDARAGSGRKPLDAKALDSTMVIRLSEAQKAFFLSQGGSPWIRQVIEACRQRQTSETVVAADTPFGNLNEEEIAEATKPLKPRSRPV